MRRSSWDLRPGEARALQERLSSQAEIAGPSGNARSGGGHRCRIRGPRPHHPGRGRRTALSGSAARRVGAGAAADPVSLRAGLLSFREIPAALGALAALACTPDLLLCDGQGLAHPGVRPRLSSGLAGRRANHRRCQVPPAWRLCPTSSRTRGVVAALGPRRARRRRRAHAARRQAAFVSPGHRVDAASAVRLTLACTGRYRLPELHTGWPPTADPIPAGRPGVAPQ